MAESVTTVAGSDSTRRGSPGVRFVIKAAVFSVALFGILRIPFIEQYLLLPFTQAQHSVACRIGGNPDAPITVGLSCSAADVIALCMGFIFAFPASIKKRLVGAGLGLLLIAMVNTVRIATLSHAVESRRWFDLLHVYIWPGVLLVVVSVFVFLWMSHALRSDPTSSGQSKRRTALSDLFAGSAWRFVLLTLLFVGIFVGTSGWWMHSSQVLAVAHWVAALGAGVIRAFGGEVTITGNVLRTGNGAFIVTQECIMTPLIPAYLAAAFGLPMSRRARAVMLAAAFPVFFLLGAARLLVLAFPNGLVGSHLVAIHGFYQFLLAIFLVVVAAYLAPRQSAPPSPLQRVFLALGVGTVAFIGLAWTYNRMLLATVPTLLSAWGHPGHDYMDPQGALLLMAPYQLALFTALWLAWGRSMSIRRAWIGLGLLVVSQPIVLAVVGEWVAHTGLEPHVAVLRAWTVVVVLVAAAWSAERLRPADLKRQHSSVEVPHG